MDVLVLIDKLDDLVHNAKQVPLTDQVRVDKDEIYDLLDQMRATIPEEIKQARWIVKERQEMLAEAKREAERLISEARERQNQLISEQEVTKQAEDDPHRGRLAGAVAPDEAADLPRRDLKGDVVERGEVAEASGDVPELEQGGSSGRLSRLRLARPCPAGARGRAGRRR